MKSALCNMQLCMVEDNEGRVILAAIDLGPVDKLDSQARQNLIQDSFCGVYLGAFADGGCRVGVL